MKKNIRVVLMVVVTSVIGFFLLVTPDIPLDDLKKRYTNEASAFMTIDGMDVHYRDEGAGQPIVLIHGTAASLHTWDAWTEKLKKDYRVIRFDLPAFGLTGSHPKRDYSIKAYMDVLDELLNQLSVDSVILVGNSLGGKIAWQYAALHPEMVSKLALLDASGFTTEKGQPWIFGLARIPILNSLISRITPRSIIKKNVEAVYFDDTKVSEALVDRYYEMALRKGNRQAFIDRAQLNMKSKLPLLAKIKCPTLILWGANDAWIPVSHALLFENALPNARTVILENAGHVPMEEVPQRSLAAFKKFLKEFN
ncbi:MAG: alpha/beta hydrolase [Cyclobacteriaceae bacterium]